MRRELEPNVARLARRDGQQGQLEAEQVRRVSTDGEDHVVRVGVGERDLERERERDVCLCIQLIQVDLSS